VETVVPAADNSGSRPLTGGSRYVERFRVNTLLRSVIPDEVWAAGVTYEISEEAREAESSMPEMYLNVYQSERPEIFFKATENHTVDPDDKVGIRGDSTRGTCPKSELGIVLYRGGASRVHNRE
jgi:2-dehydro-3-deoxy-D-arabinonate dehydratase